MELLVNQSELASFLLLTEDEYKPDDGGVDQDDDDEDLSLASDSGLDEDPPPRHKPEPKPKAKKVTSTAIGNTGHQSNMRSRQAQPRPESQPISHTSPSQSLAPSPLDRSPILNQIPNRSATETPLHFFCPPLT